MKTVCPITDDTIITTLKLAMRSGPLPCMKERAHAILLSSKGYTLSQIGDIFDIQYQTVSRWIDEWEQLGLRALYKGHSGGAQSIYNEAETERLLELIEEEPRRISYAQAKLESETGKKSSLKTLKRMIKKNRTNIQKSSGILPT